MCKSSSDALASTPASRRRSPSSAASTSFATASTSSGPRHTAATTSSTSSTSSRSSLAAARASLPTPPLLYPFHELAAATNNFLAKRSPSATYWRCSLRGRDAALYQLRALPGLTPRDAAAALARTARYHHASLAPLLGACLAGPHAYLAYSLPAGAATLAACLQLQSQPSSRAGGSNRDNKGGGFVVSLGAWLPRVQVAVDVAQGLEYVHTQAGAAHGRVSPSAVLLVPDQPQGLRATLTHFGADQFAQPDDDTAAADRPDDVRAFGVLLLQLLSGQPEASRHRFDRATKEFASVSVADTAAEAVRTGRVRTWLDRRLGDSFPVAAAEKLVEVALRCASPPGQTPEMSWVAGKVSKVYVESRAWERQMQRSDGFSSSSVSLAPR